VRQAALQGLPIYAECGGLILLAENFSWKGCRYPMAGVFPIEVEFCESPQGHGYTQLRVDSPNPFLPVGLTLRGHEFHYSRIMRGEKAVSTVCAVHRGTGCFNKRDFLVTNNVVATYTHVHALASPEWGAGMLNAARGFASHVVVREETCEAEIA
jgi:cobyrinic acid a,c-diamide synthase